MNSTYKVSLPPINFENSNERQKALLEKTKKTYRFLPNMQSKMGNYPPLLESYLDGVASFRKESGFTLIEQEVIFLVISFENNCDYCVASHSLIADLKAKMPRNIIEELREDKVLSDSKLNTLKIFTKHMLLERGFPNESETQKFMDAGYTENQILAIIHAISLKTLSNYLNHVFDTDLDTMTKVWEWKPLRSVVSFFKK